MTIGPLTVDFLVPEQLPVFPLPDQRRILVRDSYVSRLLELRRNLACTAYDIALWELNMVLLSVPRYDVEAVVLLIWTADSVGIWEGGCMWEDHEMGTLLWWRPVGEWNDICIPIGWDCTCQDAAAPATCFDSEVGWTLTSCYSRPITVCHVC